MPHVPNIFIFFLIRQFHLNIIFITIFYMFSYSYFFLFILLHILWAYDIISCHSFIHVKSSSIVCFFFSLLVFSFTSVGTLIQWKNVKRFESSILKCFLCEHVHAFISSLCRFASTVITCENFFFLPFLLLSIYFSSN